MDQFHHSLIIWFLLIAEERGFEIEEPIDLELQGLTLVLAGAQLLDGRGQLYLKLIGLGLGLIMLLRHGLGYLQTQTILKPFDLLRIRLPLQRLLHPVLPLLHRIQFPLQPLDHLPELVHLGRIVRRLPINLGRRCLLGGFLMLGLGSAAAASPNGGGGASGHVPLGAGAPEDKGSVAVAIEVRVGVEGLPQLGLLPLPLQPS